MKNLRFVRGDGGGRRFTLPGLHDVLWWLLAIGIVVAGAQLAWMVLAPVSPLGDWKPARVRLMDDGARSALMTGFDPFNRDVAVVAGPAQVATVTDLPLTLYGIRVNPYSGGGTAIIAGSDGEQQVFRIGEEVMPGVTLAAVAFDHVTLGRGGASELLYLDQSKPVPTIAPATLGNSVAPPHVAPPPPAAPARGAGQIGASDLRSGISFGGNAEGGGVTLNPGGDGSVFAGAGLRPGDVLVSVNGQAVTGQQDLAGFAGQLRPGSNVSMTVRRGGRDVPVKITVSK
ncbi:type II secretion system protein N [Croceicoccus sediminis]|uniref:type II secretion system protein N n=1 Tax=Croceicoccus sediminis TaxID=2571150 RepID=UPI0011830D37|nr:type II secretion system protein N [Croceicoccus sediminis]